MTAARTRQHIELKHAAQARTELLLDEAWQPLSTPERGGLGAERLKMIAHDPVQHAPPGTTRPILMEGQVHGGIVPGIGQTLYERTVYDGEGQLLTATFQNYAMPRADRVPSFHCETRSVPSLTNAFGMKEAGEADSIGSCPAVMNAIADVLHRAYGMPAGIDMPATPLCVREAIQAAKG